MAEPATERGRETRERILLSAVDLFHERGVNATSVDDVLAAAGAGKGQFYRYFESKEELVSTVVDHQLDRYLGWQLDALERLAGWRELEDYLDGLVAAHESRDCTGGCPVGSLALDLAAQDERLRRKLAHGLSRWEASLSVGISRLAARGELRSDAPPERLAALLLASIQGAYVLSTARRDAEVMRTALREALALLRPDRAAPRTGSPAHGTK